MSCCGRRLADSSQPLPKPPGLRVFNRGPAQATPGRLLRAMATFEYLGRTSLTAVGPATGRQYLFASPGARVAVDLRDRLGLSAVPQLREVRG